MTRIARRQVWSSREGKVEHGETWAAGVRARGFEELGCEIRIVAELAAAVPVSHGYVLRVAVAG
jgi:hypothetical protein